jgi:UDP-2,3-diacylglucosamine pyrophosphatase LpxH
MPLPVPTTYYLISDLHIGGDGGLARCLFENDLIQFLRKIAAGPQPAELIIVGDGVPWLLQPNWPRRSITLTQRLE